MVNFDVDCFGGAIADATPIADQWAGWGVSLSLKPGNHESARLFANTGGIKNGWDWGDDSISTPNTLTATHDGPANQGITIIIDFATGPDTVGIVFTDSGPGIPFVIRAFDVGGTAVDGVIINTADNTYRSTDHAEDTFCGLRHIDGIAWLELELPHIEASGIRGLELDNLYFVPEPATLSLLALGGLALIRRGRAA